MRRLIAIALVWLGCSLAWLILGSTLLVRSDDSSARMGDGVNALWGPAMRQLPPRATLAAPATAVGGAAKPPSDVPLASSAIDVALDLEHRKKGLVWFPTYSVDFRARYAFVNPDPEPREVSFELPLESEHALYDGFAVSENDRPVAAEVTHGVARWTARLGPSEKKSYDVRYRSRGTSRWQYDLTAGTGSVRDFRLSLTTDFGEVSFLPGTLSPSKHQSTGAGWSGSWEFSSRVARTPSGLARQVAYEEHVVQRDHVGRCSVTAVSTVTSNVRVKTARYIWGTTISVGRSRLSCFTGSYFLNHFSSGTPLRFTSR